MIQQSVNMFLHIRLKPIWKNKIYFSICSNGFFSLCIWVEDTEKCCSSRCIRRGGTFALQHDAEPASLVSSHQKKTWNGTKSIQQCPSKCSRRERETLSTAALQWNALQWPSTAFFREHIFWDSLRLAGISHRQRLHRMGLNLQTLHWGS